MPISHSLRAIFIHVPNTEGSSIERALNMLPPDDVTGMKLSIHYLFGDTGTGHLQHMPLADLVGSGLVDPEHLCYFKFAFVRNPWDRVVSAYFHRRKTRDIDFATFVRDVVPSQVEIKQHFWPQHDFCHGLNFVGRFENLQADFDCVCDRLGVNRVTLPHVRQREHLLYADYYTAETRSIVARVYAEDIEQFGYHFEA